MIRVPEQTQLPGAGVRAGMHSTRLRRPAHCANLLVAAISTLALLPTAVGAGVRMSASPMKFHLDLEPGTRRTCAIEVSNTGDEAIRVTTSISDWTTTHDGEMRFDPPETVERSARSWIQPDLLEFTRPPHDRRTVRVTVSMPDSAWGSYWAIVFFQGERGDRHAEFGLRTKVRIGTTFYLNARDTEGRKDNLTGMQVLPGPDGGNVILAVSLANRGNVYHYPAGWLQVLDSNGGLLLEEALPFRVLLPGRETVYRQIWRPLSPGSYRFVATFDLGLEALVQGVKEFVIPEVSPKEPAISLKQAASDSETESEPR